jgi:xanthine dehydrogenase small subunit
VLVGKLAHPHNEAVVIYESMTSCLLPLGNIHGKHIVTIEGLNLPGKLNPVQTAMAEEGATQCGFCTPGFVVSLAGYCLNGKENPVAAVDGNICRCTGYKSIERAAKKIEALMYTRNEEDPVSFLTKNEILPSYFSGVKDRLLLLDNEVQDAGVFASEKNPASKILGGGTDLYVQKPEEMVHSASRFVFDETEFNGIYKEGNRCIVGSSATVTDLKESIVMRESFPQFHRFAKLISSTPIRNMATIAGNLANASPIGDMTIFFLALNASITLIPLHAEKADGNSRTIQLRDFYRGYKQLAKEAGELIAHISFEQPGEKDFFNFEKVSKRTHLDIASVNSAIYLKFNGNIVSAASVSAGGVGPVPMYLVRTSAFLTGKTFSSETIEEAIDIMKKEISPITDTRGSKEYKSLLLGQLLKAHLHSYNNSHVV